MRRPASVTIISWMYIISGSFAFLTGVLMSSVATRNNLPDFPTGTMELRLIVSASALFFGISALKGKNYGRAGLESIGWILLCLSAFFYINDFHLGENINIPLFVMNLLAMFLPITLILYYLRTNVVRSYFS